MATLPMLGGFGIWAVPEAGVWGPRESRKSWVLPLGKWVAGSQPYTPRILADLIL